MSRPDIKPLTSLRGVVAVWVVAHHCAQRVTTPYALPARVQNVFEYGFVGVDIFFVLSGFVLAYAHFDIDFSAIPGFFRRRAARIYPLNFAATAALATVAAAGFDCGAPVDWLGLPVALLMLQPFFTSSPKWLLVNWSVGLEIACYVGFPFIMIFLRRVTWLVLLALLLAALWLEYQAERHYGTFWWGWAGLLRCVPAFLLGVLTFACLETKQRWPFQLESRFLGFAQAFLILAIVLQASQKHFQYISDLAAVLIALLYTDRGAIARLLRARPLVWLGNISYSIYLLHLPIVTLLAHKWAFLERHLVAHALYPAYLLCCLCPVLVLSHLTYHLIERPGLRVLSRKSP